MILGVLAAAFLVARSPAFWIGLVKVVVLALMPKFLKALKPRNLTAAEKEKIARGEDPFDVRPFGRGRGD